MTRSEYFVQLKNELRALPVEEQEEALEYYRCFFDDAGDDEKAMKELGTPHELAAAIIEKFACLPEVRRNAWNTNNEGTSGNFSKESVRALDISVGAAEVIMAGTDSDTFSVEYRNLAPGDMMCTLSPFGTFTVENARRIPDLERLFKKHDDGGANHPRILIKIPRECELDLVRIHVGAGSFITKDVDIKTQRSYLDVGAGNLEAGNLYGGPAELHVGMGHLKYTGRTTGLVKADCGMGQLEMHLEGNAEDYSVSGKVGLGEIRLNDKKKSGFGELICEGKKVNHFSLSCGLGEIKILIARDVL